ncbi:MAG: glycosyltransferase [Candidatus Sulfotelmatobacter sp.]
MIEQPAISVVIAAYNKSEYLRACLSCLEAAQFDRGQFEVIVVNDGSTDDTKAFLDQHQPTYSFRVVHTENQGLASARNAGIEKASGRLLVMLDNDCMLAPDALQHLYRAYCETPEAMLISTIRHIAIQNVASVMARLRNSDLSFMNDVSLRVGEENESALQRLLRLIKHNLPNLVTGWVGAQGPSVSMSADLFRQLNGYDGAIRRYGMEDFDLAFRVTKTGRRLRYVGDSVIFHLDHGHPQLNLLSDAAMTTQYFYKKHRAEPEAKPFVQFLSDQISFLEFNNRVAAAKNLPCSGNADLDLRFSVYRMADQRGAQQQQQETALSQEASASQRYCMNLLLTKVCDDMAADESRRNELQDFRSLPGQRVLVLAPHMDDEVIGCGGLVQKYRKQGAEVTVAFCTTGPGSPRKNAGEGTQTITRERITESKRAGSILGISQIVYFNLPERQLIRNIGACGKLRSLLEEKQFDVLYVPGPDEFHPDHQATFKWVQDVLPQLAKRPELYLYEVWGSCKPDRILRLDEATWEAKRRAMLVYQTQLRQLDYHKVMATLAEHRGALLAGSAPGAKAEAFRRVG